METQRNDNSGLAYRFKAKSGKLLIGFIEYFISRNCENIPVLKSEDFEFTKLFEQNYDAVRNEFENFKGVRPDINSISHEQRDFVEFNKWKFLPLYIYGNSVSENLKACPKTAELLKQIPNLTTAFFSSIDSGTHIKPHRGAYKGYLRFHFGVDIPATDDTCTIRIEDKLYHWRNGKSLIFDDTFVHDVWNETGKERTVLYVDFIRPMPSYLVVISKALTKLISKSPYIQNALRNLKNGNSEFMRKALG